VAENDTTSGPIIRWTDYGCEGWKPNSYDTIKEALEADRYSSPILITRLVQYEVNEK